MKRKAQSEIITTILLILIVLAAVVIVWMVINRFLKVGVTPECSEVKLNIASMDATADTIRVTRLAGGAGVVVPKIKVIVEGTPSTPTTSNGNLEELETETFAAPALATGNTVEIAPVVISGGQEVTCPFTDRAKAP